MSKATKIAMALGAMTICSVAVSSPVLAQNRVVPEGDTVEFTPPIDLTAGQIQQARPGDRRMLEGRSAYAPQRGGIDAPDRRDVGAQFGR